MFKKLVMPVVLLMALTMTGCGNNSKKAGAEGETPSIEQAAADGLNFDINADSDSGQAGTLQTVRFPFNSAEITAATRAALDANANFLKEHTSVQVQVEGHCDERGGVQYNIALGEKRAKRVKDYLTTLGVEAGRISTISFGKERPIAFGHDEGAWSQNRRANFVVTAK